ncbi:MAG: recombination regulator RecX [Arenicella sp.]|nr:recombination regulator RecX [Arenicella sp.]
MKIIQPVTKGRSSQSELSVKVAVEQDASDSAESASEETAKGQIEPSAGKKQRDALFAAGVRLLSMREHSLAELESKLRAKTESADLLFAVLDELKNANYQSDSRFTENYVRSRAHRGYGPVKICNELKRKGIKNSMIDEFLDVNSAVWYENARDQYDKKYGDEPVSDYNSWTKRARFMQSRGFSSEHIQLTLPPVQSD